MTSWLLWIGGGIVVTAGVAVLIWALAGDRLRGGRRLRRCPRCWYDMNGVPGLTCPECGREAREERRLHRTRRRWGWARAAALAISVGAAGIATPGVRMRGWTALIPSTAAIYALPWMDDHPPWYANLLYERVGTRTIPAWQRRMLFARCDVVLRSDAKPATKVHALGAIESVAWRGGYYGGPTREAGDALDVTLRAVGDADPGVRAQAVTVLWMVAEDPAVAVATLADVLATDPNDEVRGRALSLLDMLWNHAAPAAGAISAATTMPKSGHRVAALQLLGKLDPVTAPTTVPALARALETGDTSDKTAAAMSLVRLGPAAAPAVPSLLLARCDPAGSVRRLAAAALESTGVASDEVIAGMVDLLGDDEKYVRWAAARSLDVLARERPGTVALLRGWLGGLDALEAGSAVAGMGNGDRDIGPYAAYLLPLLATTMPDQWSSRSTAAEQLCRCGYLDLVALTPATALLNEEMSSARVWGELLVAQLQGDRRRAVPGLIGLIERSGGVSGDSNTRGEAAEALALIGPGAEAALPFLEAMLSESAWSPRENAKRAIHAITGEPLTGRLEPDRVAGR